MNIWLKNYWFRERDRLMVYFIRWISCGIKEKLLVERYYNCKLMMHATACNVPINESLQQKCARQDRARCWLYDLGILPQIDLMVIAHLAIFHLKSSKKLMGITNFIAFVRWVKNIELLENWISEWYGIFLLERLSCSWSYIFRWCRFRSGPHVFSRIWRNRVRVFRLLKVETISCYIDVIAISVTDVGESTTLLSPMLLHKVTYFQFQYGFNILNGRRI